MILTNLNALGDEESQMLAKDTYESVQAMCSDQMLMGSGAMPRASANISAGSSNISEKQYI